LKPNTFTEATEKFVAVTGAMDQGLKTTHVQIPNNRTIISQDKPQQQLFGVVMKVTHSLDPVT
jgi:hypothetical protein